MSVLTFAVRFSHAAGLDRPGRLGQQPGGFSAAFSARSFSFLFFFALARPRFTAPYPSLWFSLSFSFLTFVVARVLVPLPLRDLLPLHLVPRRWHN